MTEQTKPKRRELMELIAALELQTSVQQRALTRRANKIEELKRENQNLGQQNEHQAVRLRNQASTIDMRGRDIASLQSANTNQAKQIQELKDQLANGLSKGVIKEREEDQRISAWDRICHHPFFASCFRETTGSLMSNMIAKLDAQEGKKYPFDTVAYSKDLEKKLSVANAELRESREQINKIGINLANSARENVQKYHEIQELKDQLARSDAKSASYTFKLAPIDESFQETVNKFLATQGPQPKFKVGDIVRLPRAISDENKLDQPDVEFVVTRVKKTQFPETTGGEFWYEGDPAGRGVWENFLEKVELDPKPYVGDITGKRYATNEIDYYNVHFLPRPLFAQNRSVYPTPPWTARIDGKKGSK